MKKSKFFIRKFLWVLFIILLIITICLIFQKVKEKNIATETKITTVKFLRSELNKNINSNISNSCVNAKLGLIYFEKGYYKFAKERFIQVLTTDSSAYPCRYEEIISKRYNILINRYSDTPRFPKIIERVYKPLITIYLSEGRTEEAEFFLEMSNQILSNKKYDSLTIDELKNKISNENLLALPYLQYGTEIAEKNKIGITTNNKTGVYKGYVSYVSIYGGFIWDLEGNIVASSIKNYNKASNQLTSNITPPKMMYDVNVWHHDFYILEDGSFITIMAKNYNFTGRDTKFDDFVYFNKKEEEISRWSTYRYLSEIQEHFNEKEYEFLSSYDSETKEYDYFHANSVQILPETNIGKKDERFQKGNWLVSLPKVNLVLIIDQDSKEIVWSFGPGKLEFQHAPRMLNNGNLIIFDNGVKRKYSRVIELNPINKKIVWEYKGTPKNSFFSSESSNAQRLPNGNTLITEGEKGRVFEVTPHKEIVWEFYNPNFNEKGQREKIYRAFKLEKKVFDNLKEDNVLTLFEKIYILIISSVT